tara:strand:- start:4722 stop:5363 length:642 start_codon:yes stop_codon:yes gene_type:complete
VFDGILIDDHLYSIVFFFLSLYRFNLGVMGAEILLKVEESYLNVGGGSEKILELLIQDENSAVVGVLKTVLLNVSVNSTSYGTARNELAVGETEEIAELIRNLLLAVETVVLSAVGRLFTGGIVKLSLDLTNDLSERLDVRAKSGNLSEARITSASGVSRHYTLHTRHIFNYLQTDTQDVHNFILSLYINGREELSNIYHKYVYGRELIFQGC